jgi:hypothetical protein
MTARKSTQEEPITALLTSTIFSTTPQIRDYLKENVVAEDGTIDIPVYVVEWRGILIGWLQGQIERPSFKKKLVEILANRKK